MRFVERKSGSIAHSTLAALKLLYGSARGRCPGFCCHAHCRSHKVIQSWLQEIHKTFPASSPLLGHTKRERMVRYLVIEIDDALDIRNRPRSKLAGVGWRQNIAAMQPSGGIRIGCLGEVPNSVAFHRSRQ